MTAIFYNMIHDSMEDYVDDIMVKFKRSDDHISYLE